MGLFKFIMTARRRNVRHSTLLCQTWDAPARPVVTTSAAWALALDRAGETPEASRTEVVIKP